MRSVIEKHGVFKTLYVGRAGNVREQEAASYRIDELYRYARGQWGTQRASRQQYTSTYKSASMLSA
ncbi:hypothetical protein VSX61_01120 [Brenneria populi subsp. brevivirga]|uniref:hypothetical protein n=1 Tax=Brenneria populi TaxID=1505588 RepID=UPI002E16C9CF|nr:hypothetical protein [Brenneria populi subsp. brevivirga]